MTAGYEVRLSSTPDANVNISSQPHQATDCLTQSEQIYRGTQSQNGKSNGIKQVDRLNSEIQISHQLPTRKWLMVIVKYKPLDRNLECLRDFQHNCLSCLHLVSLTKWNATFTTRHVQVAGAGGRTVTPEIRVASSMW